MVFSSAIFLFAFLPGVLAVYFLCPARFRQARNVVLLCFSFVFYFYGEPKGIFVMLASILANYFFALCIDKSGRRNVRLALLALAVVFNIGVLFFYKYTGFLFQNINRFLSLDLAIPQIIMPIGISFFTFQGMSYVFDVYRKTVPVQRNILSVSLYIAMFPQLVAGPIVRYESIAAALADRKESLDTFYSGLKRFVCGLSKKMLLANSLGVLAAEVFAANDGTLAAGMAWVGAIAYSFQILFDFSGYSDMAIGMGRMFGFEFPENFDYPYIARSVTEFWRRWHISLSSWFKDYVYIPLGGSRRGLPRQIFNLFVVWTLTGFWHGASWNFVLWGGYFALLLVIEKLFLLSWLEKACRPLGHIYALFFIVLGWVIFNGGSLRGVLGYLGAMFSFSAPQKLASDYVMFALGQYKMEFIFALLLSTPVCKVIARRFQGKPLYELCVGAAVLGLFFLSLLSVVNTSFNPFIYFRF